ncbi:MAG TPA: hypothetical protein VKB86_00285 [Pyrinomonadaceae bacterium]|nr:hypothetical protein [Pyrinomonadaceae bacterium]
MNKDAKRAEANMLFNLLQKIEGGNHGEPSYEFLCVLDDVIDAASRVYSRREFFVPMYLDAIKEGGQGEVLNFILRELRKGTDPKVIAHWLDEGRRRMPEPKVVNFQRWKSLREAQHSVRLTREIIAAESAKETKRG